MMRAPQLGRDIALWHHRARLAQPERLVGRTQFQDFSVRRAGAREREDDAGRARHHFVDLLLEASELNDTAVLAQHEMRELAAVAILYRRNDQIARIVAAEEDLGNAGQPVLLAQHERIAAPIAAEFVEVNLLIEEAIGFRLLVAGIAVVPEP